METGASGFRDGDSSGLVVRVIAFADGLGLTMEHITLLDQLASQSGQIKSALTAASVVDDIRLAMVGMNYPAAAESTTPPTATG